MINSFRTWLEKKEKEWWQELGPATPDKPGITVPGYERFAEPFEKEGWKPQPPPKAKLPGLKARTPTTVPSYASAAPYDPVAGKKATRRIMRKSHRAAQDPAAKAFAKDMPMPPPESGEEFDPLAPEAGKHVFASDPVMSGLAGRLRGFTPTEVTPKGSKTRAFAPKKLGVMFPAEPDPQALKGLEPVGPTPSGTGTDIYRKPIARSELGPPTEVLPRPITPPKKS